MLDIALVGERESHVAMATNSKEVKVFDRETGSCQLLSQHSGVVLSLSSNVDGSLLATGSKDNTVRLWMMNPDTKMFDCVAMGTGHTHAVGAAAMSRYFYSRIEVTHTHRCTHNMYTHARHTYGLLLTASLFSLSRTQTDQFICHYWEPRLYH